MREAPAPALSAFGGAGAGASLMRRGLRPRRCKAFYAFLNKKRPALAGLLRYQLSCQCFLNAAGVVFSRDLNSWMKWFTSPQPVIWLISPTE